jgi:7-cyano-7-deazaguanine synthase in queuosine biosynthesis
MLNTTYHTNNDKAPQITIDESIEVLEEMNKFFGNIGQMNSKLELVLTGEEACSYVYNLVRNSNYKYALLNRDDYREFVQTYHERLTEANPHLVTPDENNYFISIHTPLMYLNKAETFQLAEKEGILDIVIEDSHTCYIGDRSTRHNFGWGCGTCPACTLRKKGYEEYLINSCVSSKFH